MALCVEVLTRATLGRQRHGEGTFWPLAILNEARLLRMAPESGWFLGWLDDLPIVTFCLMDADPDVWPEAGEGEALYLHRLAVDPEYQGQGFSRLALDFAVAETRRRGRPVLRLNTGADRQKLLDLYSGYGFRCVGVRPLRHYTSARFELALSPAASGHT